MSLSPTMPRRPRPAVSFRLKRLWHRQLREPLLTILLVLQLFILFALPSLRSLGLRLPHIVVYCVLLIFVGLATLVARSRTATITMIVSVALTIVGTIWRQEQPDLLTDALRALGQVLTQASLLWVVASAVFGRGRTTAHRIIGGVVMYLSLGMIFTDSYLFVAEQLPVAFTKLPADPVGLRESLSYFSFCTLTTGNFGDIIPVHPVARSLANLESICGQLFPATLLARIIGRHNEARKLSDGL